MTEQDILNTINDACVVGKVRFPSKINFSICGTKLNIEIKNEAVFNNMQTDSSSFEGWAICLKAWLPDIIKEVELVWDIPNEKEDESNKWLHYHRFLYRALRFDEFYDWFSVSTTNQLELENFKKKLVGLQNNCFSRKPLLKGNQKNRLSETIIEYYLANDFSKQLRDCLDLDFIDRQFPVGVKKDGRPFFTGGRSAIDLWGTKDNKLTIIELKYNGTESSNIKVGIISELFMYSCIMRDILKGVISTPNRSPNDNEMQFYENSKKHQYTHIEARMLSDRYHPLLSNSNVIDVMNYQKPGVEDVKITYYKNAYKLFNIE